MITVSVLLRNILASRIQGEFWGLIQGKKKASSMLANTVFHVIRHESLFPNLFVEINVLSLPSFIAELTKFFIRLNYDCIAGYKFATRKE